MKKKILCALLVLTVFSGSASFAEFDNQTDETEQSTVQIIEQVSETSPDNEEILETTQVNQEIPEILQINEEDFPDNAISDEEIENSDSSENEENVPTVVADVIIRPATSTVIEFEDYYEGVADRITSDSNASGGKFIKNTWGPQQTEVIDLTVSAEVEGDYYVTLVANGGGTAGGAISQWSFAVNDNNIYTTNSVSTPCDWEYGDIFKMTTFSGTTVHLTKGINTVSLTVPPSTGGGSVVKYMADCVVFYQPKNISDIIVESSEIVKVGDSISVTTYSQDNEELISTDYDSLEISTDTPMYIKIQGNNAVALNHGKGKITVKVTSNGKTFTKTNEVAIAASNGLHMDSLKHVYNETENKDEIVLTVKACGNYTGGGNLIFAGYPLKNGLKTLMNYDVVALTSMTDGEVKEYKIDATNYSEDKAVNVFMYAGRVNTLRVIAAMRGIQQ